MEQNEIKGRKYLKKTTYCVLLPCTKTLAIKQNFSASLKRHVSLRDEW